MVCSICGSAKIEKKAWALVYEGDKFVDYVEDGSADGVSAIYCPICVAGSNMVTKEQFDDKSKIVLDNDNTTN